MSILNECPGKGYKLCRKKLHWYLPGKGCTLCRNARVNTDYHKKTAAGKAWYQQNLIKNNREWPGQLDCQKNSVYAIFPKELTDLLND